MSASVETDFDDVLKEVARRIFDAEDIDNLGKALGFLPADIGRFKQTNTRHHDVDYSGTLTMLRKWHENQTKAEEQNALIDVLRNANLELITDELFPASKSDNKSGNQPEHQATRISHSKVSDSHIKNLSQLLHTTHYHSLSCALGIKYNIADGIEKEKMRNYPDMYIKLLHVWNVESNKTLRQLDHALKEAGAGGLISQYKDHKGKSIMMLS